MARQQNIILQPKSSYALNHQMKLGQYDFPFTLNPTMGCFFVCKYCYSPWVAYGWNPDRKERFFETIHIKLDKPQHLSKELPRYAALPVHMKRVQINETSEYYLPQVLRHLQRNNQPDLMLGILDEFDKAWKVGNKWMLHILTKSHLILNHLDKLKQMKHMVQIEVSFATYDENIRSQIEFFTTSIKRRLELIEALSKEGIFVRVMAMPFYGGHKDLIKLKKEAFNRGAQAFKNKGLNYYSWNDLIQVRTYDQFINDKIPRSKGRLDEKDESLIIKSGENVLIKGKPLRRSVLFPIVDYDFKTDSNWSAMSEYKNRFKRKSMKVIDSGYADCNTEKWGYIS
jgi:DNA repair photolyase